MRFHRCFEKKIVLLLTILFTITSVTSTNAIQIDFSGRVFSLNSDDLLIRSHLTEVDIFDTSVIIVKETFVVQNLQIIPISSITLWVNQSIASLLITDAEGSLSFDWIPVTNSSNKVTVYFRFSLLTDDSATFTLGYDLFYDLTLIPSEVSYYSFEFVSTISFFTLKYTMSVQLPANSFVHEETESVIPIYPTNADDEVKQNRIILTWELSNVTEFANPLFIVRFNEPLIIEEPSTFFSNNFNIFMFGTIIGFFLGISGTSWMIRYREKKTKSKLGQSLLTENQKFLIRLIYEKQGKISQKDLCEVTGFSKSKISRNLVPLEERGLIIREKWGRTYVVYLTEDGSEVIQ